MVISAESNACRSGGTTLEGSNLLNVDLTRLNNIPLICRRLWRRRRRRWSWRSCRGRRDRRRCDEVAPRLDTQVVFVFPAIVGSVVSPLVPLLRDDVGDLVAVLLDAVGAAGPDARDDRPEAASNKDRSG